MSLQAYHQAATRAEGPRETEYRLFAQVTLVRSGRRAEQPPRAQPGRQVALAASDQPARVQAAADLDHLRPQGALAGEVGHWSRG